MPLSAVLRRKLETAGQAHVLSFLDRGMLSVEEEEVHALRKAVRQQESVDGINEFVAHAGS